MILALTAMKSNPNELVEVADSVMGVIPPSIDTVAIPKGTEVGEIMAKVAGHSLIYRPLDSAEATGEPDPTQILHCSLQYVGTTVFLAIL